jgi:hypothetical protein
VDGFADLILGRLVVAQDGEMLACDGRASGEIAGAELTERDARRAEGTARGRLARELKLESNGRTPFPRHVHRPVVGRQ